LKVVLLYWQSPSLFSYKLTFCYKSISFSQVLIPHYEKNIT
jgi:hypothetical protein